MSWLDQVQRAQEDIPAWLLDVLEHPEFAALHRDYGEYRWRVFSRDDGDVGADTLRDVCRKFSDGH